MSEPLSYLKAGVDIGEAEAAKRDMAASLASTDIRVLNSIGAFATLFDGTFPEYEHPVLVLKTEEPGSKQKLAFEHGEISSICYDLVNHLINDIIVLGAAPLSVQDAIICGKLDKAVIARIVEAMAGACRAQGCTLTGGETSEQPGVIEAGTYILTASVVGVVEKAKIIDGTRITAGDQVLAVASNGLHTNGFSLVRALIDRKPEILEIMVNGVSFLKAVLTPHKCYYQSFKGLFDLPGLHGLAHITGGGIEGNLVRILPDGLRAVIDLSRIEVLPVFRIIRELGEVDDVDMRGTFNLGVGLTLVADRSAMAAIQGHLLDQGCRSYIIGEVLPGEKSVTCRGELQWPKNPEPAAG